MRKSDFPKNIPHIDLICEKAPDILANGGSCLAGPDGKWIIKPHSAEEGLLTATITHNNVRRERQNFDLSGHYSRPDVTPLILNRERQKIISIKD